MNIAKSFQGRNNKDVIVGHVCSMKMAMKKKCIEGALMVHTMIVCLMTRRAQKVWKQSHKIHCFICGKKEPYNECNLKTKIPRDNWYVNSGKKYDRNTTFQQAEAPSSGGSVAPSSVTAPTAATTPAPSPPPLQPPRKETGFGFYTMSQPADVYITEPVHNINVKSDPYDLSKVLMLDSGSTCHMGNKHIHGTRETTNRPINVTT